MTASDKGPVKVELLPCPFCGGGDLRVAYLRASSDCQFWRVECANSECDAGTLGPSADTDEKAVAAWNARASTDQQALVAELVEAVEPFAEHADFYNDCEEHPNGCPDDASAGEMPDFKVRDFRRARALIAKVRGGEGR